MKKKGQVIQYFQKANVAIKILFISLLVSTPSFAKNLKKNVIVKIAEASGICYSSRSNTLFVANDEGKVFEISKKGDILREKKLGKYDLEGLACDNENATLLFAVEGDDAILIVNQKNLKIEKQIAIKRKFQGKKILKKDKEHGLEAITIVKNAIFLSNQSYNRYPKEDASVIFQINTLKKKRAKIVKVIDHGYVDVAAMTYHKDNLYMISDKKNLLVIYDINAMQTLQEIKLKKFAQEGLCFDNENMLYIADDEGRVLKFHPSEIGIK